MWSWLWLLDRNWCFNTKTSVLSLAWSLLKVSAHCSLVVACMKEIRLSWCFVLEFCVCWGSHAHKSHNKKCLKKHKRLWAKIWCSCDAHSQAWDCLCIPGGEGTTVCDFCFPALHHTVLLHGGLTFLWLLMASLWPIQYDSKLYDCTYARFTQNAFLW